MKNLYSFSKDAWFVKLYKWLYNVDPTQKYKNMCPMFWSMLITFILLPFMVILKLCGDLSSKFYKWNGSKKEEKLQKRKQKFIEYCNKELTTLEAYKLYNSKDWMEFSYYLSNILWHKIYDLYEEHKYKNPKIKQKVYFDWDLIFLGFVFLLLLLFVGCVIWSIEWGNIDWKLLGSALLNVIELIVFLVGFYNILKYLFYNDKVFGFFDKMGDFIKNIANKIWHGIKIVVYMIKNIYNKNCPLIEWKDK